MRHGTYSIVARDPDTGQLGVAVQSHWFSVGSVCAWARAGAGAVATQSVIEPSYGPLGLESMAAGATARAALDALVGLDAVADMRQVGFVDALGGVAAHTGAGCIEHAGHVLGDGVSCQANMMLRPTVPAAMLAAYEQTAGELAERLLAALEAAEREGGDLRGRQSAALVVVPARGRPWDRDADVRVDDHEAPLGELARLLRLQRAYALAARADELQGAGQAGEAGELYRRAAATAPESDELEFWAGLALARSDPEAGIAVVRRAVERNPGWRVMLERVPAAFAPTAGHVLRELGRT